MAAPCIVRLDKAISETNDSIQKACLLAEKACYLTRIGDQSGAEAIRAELRLGFSDGRSLKVSVLVMLLEGLQSYFQSLGGDAKDRLMRAQLLSKAAKNNELTAITSAWLAHVQFREARIGEAIENIRLAIETVEYGQWSAVCRISCVLGDIFFWVGDQASSKRWYANARHAAVEYGDQAALGAIPYNQSAFRVFDLRLRSAWGLQLDPLALQLADAESRSAENYQSAAGLTSLEHLLIGVRVGVHMLYDRYPDALKLLTVLLREGQIPSNYDYGLVLRSDAILCCVKLKLEVDAREHLKILFASRLNELPTEDQIIIYTNLNRAVETNALVFDALYGKKTIDTLTASFHAERATILPALSDFADVPESLRRRSNED